MTEENRPDCPGRRRFLAGLAALGCAPALARAADAARPLRLAATWQAGRGYRAGILEARSGLTVLADLELPTRAHGLWAEAGGTLLTLARRPGDWLLRWSPEGRPLGWRWIEPGRAFCGHVLASSDGRTLYTTETDLDTGAGLVGVRDAASLEKRAEWPTLGPDPHQLVRDPRRPGRIIVANGGVPTRPETGRLKRDLDRMDSSLAVLDAAGGACLGQWRLEDPRLSLRHLAWGRGAGGPLLGIALQAEHDDPEGRAAAPVLALFDGSALTAAPGGRALSGYGGDIAFHQGCFAVSCPRAQGVALFDAGGAARGFLPLAESCPLAATPQSVWAGGRLAARSWRPGGEKGEMGEMAIPDIRLDNHWIVL